MKSLFLSSGGMPFAPGEFVFFVSEVILVFLRPNTPGHDISSCGRGRRLPTRQLTSAAVASCGSTLGLPLAFFPSFPPSSLVLDLFLEGTCPSDSELVIPPHQTYTKSDRYRCNSASRRNLLQTSKDTVAHKRSNKAQSAQMTQPLILKTKVQTTPLLHMQGFTTSILDPPVAQERPRKLTKRAIRCFGTRLWRVHARRRAQDRSQEKGSAEKAM